MSLLFRCLRDASYAWQIRAALVARSVLAPLLVVVLAVLEKQLIDQVILAKAIGRLFAAASTYGFLWLVLISIGFLGSLLDTHLSQLLWHRLSRRFMAHSNALSLAFSRKEHSGQILTLFGSDLPAVVSLQGSTVYSFITTIVMLLVSIAVMLKLSWQLAVAVALIPPIVSAAAFVLARPVRPAVKKAQAQIAKLTEQLHETLAGVREIAAFGHQEARWTAFEKQMLEVMRLRFKIAALDAGFSSGQALFAMLVAVVVFGFGGYLYAAGWASLGTLFAIRTLFGQVSQHLSQFTQLTYGVQKQLGSAERLYAFLDQVPRVKEADNPQTLASVRGHLCFDQVSFCYEPDRPVLTNITFQALPGETIALVGPSGGGKSTLVSLIARFYDPDSGMVSLDGVDLRDLSLAALRDSIGMVFQDTFLFSTSIRENILLGRPNASESEVIAAAKAANAWEFIGQIPGGLDAVAGERGVQLSEGQRQRLAIARAFLRNPQILILDEPTSALDAGTERLVQTAIQRLMRGRTTVVIAHRLGTIQHADKILVVNEGRIIESGTHSELMQSRGMYWELTTLQSPDLARTDAADSAGVRERETSLA